jgi:hypothetical protein
VSASQPLTGDELAAIKARAEEATPGPWAMWDGYGPTNDGLMGVYRFGPADGTHVIEDGDGGHALYARRDDWDFIATAREDVPRLVAEVERLRAREHALLLHLDEAERAARRA